MRDFTQTRTHATPDEFWLVEHDPVYTLGQVAKPEHLLAPGDIPVVRTDRGGQVTYHGPGQVVGYALFDLCRMQVKVHEFVRRIEECMILVLADHGVIGERWDGRPGVYVRTAKIGALGIRIRRGCTYHGLAFNVSMDPTPFHSINPCGMANLAVTQLSELADVESLHTVGRALADHVRDLFGFSSVRYIPDRWVAGPA